MNSRRPFREFDDSYDAESLRLARRVIRGLTLQVQHIVVCPGSRSAPLAYALAEAEQLGAMTVHMRIDERSAAFTALGIALATDQPAGIVTTSGTAAGNLTPAVMEADMSGVPLVVITADRPQPMHGTGANQTVWQQGMFSGRVRDEIHLEQSAIGAGQLRLDPDSRDDMLAAETQVALLLRQAVARSAKEAPGPVHLNIGFADPLVPAQVPQPQAGAQRWARRGIVPPKERERLYQAARPLSPAEQMSAAAALENLENDDDGAAGPADRAPRRTVFVIGHNAPAEAAELARRAGHPVLAEPTSGARWSDLGAIQGYRLLLQAPEGSAAQRLVASAETIVVAGRPTLTRPVQRLISRTDAEVVQYAPAAEPWHDDRLPRRVVGDLKALAHVAGFGPARWRQSWEESGLAAQRILDAELRGAAEGKPGLSSVRVAQFVAETVRTPLVLGSSSVIRDVDLAAVLTRDPAGSSGRNVYALRGLSGIDGNLSAASGIAITAGQRVTALLGDLTMLHDINALLIPSTEQQPNLDVVVINDAGGAIFDQLEHGEVARRPEQRDAVDRLFGTPQSVDLEALADAYHTGYVCAEDLAQLGAALAHPDDRVGVRIIEVRTEREGLRALHAKITARAAEL